MVAYQRTRTQGNNTQVNGSHYKGPSIGWVSENTTFNGIKTTTDVVGNRAGPNMFNSEFVGTVPRWIDGAGGGHIWHKCPLWNVSGVGHLLSTGTPSSATKQAWANQIAGDTQPLAPDVSLPTFIGELREVPALIKSFGIGHLKRISQYRTGESFAAEAASRHLQWRWGIRPMISDLKKMLDFVSAVDKRMGWFNALASGAGLHRRCRLDEQNAESIGTTTTIYSSGAFIHAKPRTVTTQKVWGSAWWKLKDFRHFPRTNAQRLHAAKRAVFGWTPEGLVLAAWELFPWSWLIDWFTGFGSFLNYAQGAGSVTAQWLCAMRHTITWREYIPYDLPNYLTLTGRVVDVRETKQRYPLPGPNPVTISLLPLLSGDKWSILGSLAVSRRFK